MNEVEHSREQHGLGFEAGLVICVGEDEEHVLQDRDKELLEESIRRGRVRLCNVSNQFEAHVEASVFDLAVIVLACPHARIDDEFELSVVEFQKRFMIVRETPKSEKGERTHQGNSEG